VAGRTRRHCRGDRTPAVGKTTLLKHYVTRTPSVRHVRDIAPLPRGRRQDNYLTRYLRGDRSFAFLCQMETLLLRTRQTLTAGAASIMGQNIIAHWHIRRRCATEGTSPPKNSRHSVTTIALSNPPCQHPKRWCISLHGPMCSCAACGREGVGSSETSPVHTSHSCLNASKRLQKI
jgi:hypothetical protein